MDIKIMLNPKKYGYKMCDHRSGYGSFLKEGSDPGTKCTPRNRRLDTGFESLSPRRMNILGLSGGVLLRACQINSVRGQEINISGRHGIIREPYGFVAYKQSMGAVT